MSDPVRQAALEELVADKLGQMAAYLGYRLDSVLP